MPHLIIVVCAILALLQPPAPAQPKGPAPATTTAPQHQPRPALRRVSDAHRKLITTRAADLFELSNGEILDLYRINRIRAQGQKGQWTKIKPRDLLDLGAGHYDYGTPRILNSNLDPTIYTDLARRWPSLKEGHKYIKLPGLAAFDQDASPDLSSSTILIAAPYADKLYTNRDMFLQMWIPTADHGPRVVEIKPGDLTISTLITGGALIRYTGTAQHEEPPYGLVRGAFFAAGNFSGHADGESILSDCVIFRTGTHTYPDPVGARHTVPSFRLEWLNSPVTPERLAELTEAGRPLVTWSHSTSGSTTTWRAVPQAITFKPE